MRDSDKGNWNLRQGLEQIALGLAYIAVGIGIAGVAIGVGLLGGC